MSSMSTGALCLGDSQGGRRGLELLYKYNLYPIGDNVFKALICLCLGSVYRTHLPLS